MHMRTRPYTFVQQNVPCVFGTVPELGGMPPDSLMGDRGKISKQKAPYEAHVDMPCASILWAFGIAVKRKRGRLKIENSSCPVHRAEGEVPGTQGAARESLPSH